MRNEEALFRNMIFSTLGEFGLDKEGFYIGYGANNWAVIRCDATSNVNKEKHKYAIQFCESEKVIFICDIKKRIELEASLNLYWKDLCWKDVKELRVKSISIALTSTASAVAVMPFSYFQMFLKANNSCGFEMDIQTVPKEMEEDEYYLVRKEGAKIEVYSTRYERNTELRKKAIDKHGYKCCACGFLFSKVYGIEYIEVHHIEPLSTYKSARDVNAKTDLVCLCANCHRIVHHKRNAVLSIEELKSIIERQKSNEEELP